jgi:hypothetical protein
VRGRREGGGKVQMMRVVDSFRWDGVTSTFFFRRACGSVSNRMQKEFSQTYTANPRTLMYFNCLLQFLATTN